MLHQHDASYNALLQTLKNGHGPRLVNKRKYKQTLPEVDEMTSRNYIQLNSTQPEITDAGVNTSMSALRIIMFVFFKEKTLLSYDYYAKL